jgi:hypothetical protein
VRRTAAALGVAIAGSQAGHLLTYELRFGAAAQQLQSSGSHAYLPFLVKTLLGAAALALVATLLLVGFARVAAGRKLDPHSTPPLLRLIAALYTMQLALFVIQETLEGGASGVLLLWALLGQLPVAFIGAVALRCLLGRLAPALATITRRCEPALQLYATSVVVRPTHLAPVAVVAAFSGPITRRGPPPSF